MCEVLDVADECGIVWDNVEGMSDGEAYRLFYPDKQARESVFEELDWKRACGDARRCQRPV